MKPMLIVVACLASVLSGCGERNETAKTQGAGGGAAKTTIQLNWKPEPQFGGFYAAAEGIDTKHGVELDIVSGGVGTPTVQMVAAGQVDFAVVSADEVILSRRNDADVVALFAVYQTNPQGLMTHAARGFDNISDIFAHQGTVAMQSGLPYAQHLKNKYGFDKVKIVPSPGGDLSGLRDDPNFTQQVFVTSEPIAAKKLGLDLKSFLIADAGYNPYTTVLVTRAEVWQKNPELVKKVVAAVREGWQTYLADPKPTNDAMRKLNPSMDAETFAASAEVQKPLIETEETRKHGLGSMTVERWGTLARQLVELKVIDSAPAPESLFVEVK